MTYSLKANSATSAVNPDCLRRTFILDYSYPGQTRKVKQQMLEMSLNSSIWDIARVLQVGDPTVIRELRKRKPHLSAVNQKALENLNPEQVEVEIHKVEEAEETTRTGAEESELDEMWSVGIKKNPRWLFATPIFLSKR